MTKNQIKFLEAIYKNDKTAEELCKELKIKPYDDPSGGAYNALNEYIDYLQTDDENEIDDMFTIITTTSKTPNEDRYKINSKGEKYIKSYKRNRLIFIAIILVVGIIIFYTSLKLLY